MRISISEKEQNPLYLYLERVRCPYRHTPRRLKTDLFYKVYQRVFFCTQESLKSCQNIRRVCKNRWARSKAAFSQTISILQTEIIVQDRILPPAGYAVACGYSLCGGRRLDDPLDALASPKIYLFARVL